MPFNILHILSIIYFPVLLRSNQTIMKTRIFINTTFNETRVCVFEDDTLSEVYIERSSEPQIVGNIYKGRIGKVVPGMQAAFVDIGLEKSGFISVEDVYEESLIEYFLEENEENIPERKDKQLIQDILNEDQEVIVQVIKEPVNSKGPKLSSYIGIPGKYTVLLGTIDMTGISRKIEDNEERERLTGILKSNKPDNIGFIARTASTGINESEIKEDMDNLIGIWKKIKNKSEHSKSPYLLYQEPKLYLRAVRDFITNNVEEIIIDSGDIYKEISDYIMNYQPDKESILKLYKDKEPLFRKHGIEEDLNKLYNRKVWLKSGAHLIIEEAEGLTVIDVNTGKFTSNKGHEETIYKINLEAAREAARQIRLRNLVGIIVIDFIDMKSQELKDKIYENFGEALKYDKARSVVYPMSAFGVIQLTRQRVRESILKSLAESCPVCDGTGYVKSRDTVCYEIIRELRYKLADKKPKEIKIVAHRDILENLKKKEGDNLNKLSKDYKTKLKYDQADVDLKTFDLITEK